MKRIATILLAALLLITSISCVACADNGNQQSTDGNKDRLYLDNLPDDLDFEGKEIVIVYAEGGGYNFTQRSIEPDEDSADNVDRKIYERNTTIETRLNVDVVALQASSTIRDLQNAITSSLAAASGEYDVIAGYQYYDINLAAKGYLINFNDLGKGDYADAGYIDMDADYWSKSYIDSISYNGSTYWITGDLALRYLGGMYCTFVNASIYDEKLKEEYGDIYTLAKEGKWNLDLLNEMAGKCYEDLGVEGTDEEDVLGYAYEINDPIDGIAMAADVDFSTEDFDGSMRMELRSPRSITFVEKLDTLLHSNYTLLVGHSDSANVMNAFASGNIAFHVNKLFQAETYLRDMESNYYIIPAPKLNADQPNYVTGIHDGCTLFGIPFDAPDVAASAATLEALAAESLRIVTPEYYESSLKFKYTRDDTAAEMIDIMRANAESNFAAAWSASCNDIAQYFRNNSYASNAASQMKKISDAADTKLQELLATLDELKNNPNK